MKWGKLILAAMVGGALASYADGEMQDYKGKAMVTELKKLLPWYNEHYDYISRQDGTEYEAHKELMDKKINIMDDAFMNLLDYRICMTNRLHHDFKECVDQLRR